MSLTENAFIFERLKQCCVKIATNCTIEDINKLEKAVSNTDKTLLVPFQEYVLFPFHVLLKKNIHEKLIIRSLDFLTFFFQKCPISSTSVFTLNFSLLINYISVPEETIEGSKLSEEVKNSVCLCISSLIENSTEEVFFHLFQSSFRLPLAQAFFTLIGLLKIERSKALRQNVLLTIGNLIGNGSYLKPWTQSLESSVSSSIATLFPGICVALANVSCGDAKQGHLVISTALRSLGRLIALVLGDHIEISKEEYSADVSDVPFIQRNEAWFQEVTSKVDIVMQNCTVLVNHEHWKVRQELVSFSEVVLFSCIKRLPTSISILLPAVFALSVDVQVQVSEQSKALIEKISHHFDDFKSVSLIAIVREDVLKTSSKLIKSKLSSNDNEKLLILKSIQGYLQILSKSVNDLLFSMNHLEKLMLSLLNLLEFDTTKVNLVEETKGDWNGQPLYKKWPKMHFLYFHKEDILNTVRSICYYLGEHGHVRLLVDYLIEKLQDSEIFSLQITFLIGCLVEGSKSNLTTDCSSLINSVMDEILALLLRQSTSQNRAVKIYQETVDFTAGQVYSGHSLYQNCLVLEVIEKCSRTLGKEFKAFLNQVLFHVMERAGSPNYIISQAGRLCLHSIAHSCGYSSVAELVRENADYLVNSITLSFHHFAERPETAVVLRIIIEESDEKILHLIRDCIYNILSILDCNQNKAFFLMIVLKSITKAIYKWFGSTTSNKQFNSPNHDESLKMYFLHKKRKQETLNNLLNDDCESQDEVEEDKADDSESVEESNSKKAIPLHVNILCEILTRCIHLQSSRNLHTQVICLEITELCILALRDYKNQLHPLIHEFWDPFMQRFTEDSAVVLEAFKVLLVIANECRDFVRARVLKDVVPKIINFLKINFSAVHMKTKFCDYQWTSMCKLQVHLLNHIGGLFSKIEVGDKEIALLAEACLPYLKKEQPKVFQEAALKTIHDLSLINPDAIWLYYHEMFSKEQVLLPPYEELLPIKFPHSCRSDTEKYLNF